jgi:hypothetical protein
MKSLFRGAAKTLAVLSLTLSAAHATVIDYTSAALGGNRWRFDYTIHNDTLGAPLDEFTVFFDENLFANLADATGPSDWDLLLIQPDTAIPAAGYFDGLALAGGIAAGDMLSGFSVTFDYLGAGAPGAQLFSIVDPVSFDELDSGVTHGPHGVPLPGSLPLMLAGMGAMAYWQRRRQGGAS